MKIDADVRAKAGEAMQSAAKTVSDSHSAKAQVIYKTVMTESDACKAALSLGNQK